MFDLQDLFLNCYLQIVYSSTQKVGEIIVEPVKAPASSGTQVANGKKTAVSNAAVDDDEDDIDIDEI